MPIDDRDLPVGFKTANEELFDAMVRHQIYLMRLSASLKKKVDKLLNETEIDIADKIRSRLLNNTGLTSKTDVKKLEVLLRIIRNIRVNAWEKVTEAWVEEALLISQLEPEILSSIIITTAPVVVETILPSISQLKAIVNSRPFEGRVLRDWAEAIAQEDLRRIENAIRVGMVSGEASDDIAKRVIGTVGLRGVDGMTEITRRQADAIVRTAINFVANEARKEFLDQNSDLFEKELYVATLDSRTTAVCRANDGQTFPRGKGPFPPLHFRCRSLRVPVLLGDPLGNRPAKPVTEKMLLREFSEKEGISPAPKERKFLPNGYKGRFDEFARIRIRQLTGQVPSVTSYQKWLEGQSKEFQDDVLGKTKAKLFREGKLKLDKFVNKQGDELTLSELAKKHAEAFKAAGLDPSAFQK